VGGGFVLGVCVVRVGVGGGGVVVVMHEPLPRLSFVEVAYSGVVPESSAFPTLV